MSRYLQHTTHNEGKKTFTIQNNYKKKKITDKPIMIRRRSQKDLKRHQKKGNPNGQTYEKMLHLNSNQ